MYFRNPIEVARNHFEQIAQVSVFQKKQMARVLAFYKYKSSELEIKLQEESKLSKQRESELAELRKENSELKNLLSHVKLSQSPLQQNSFFVVVVSYRGNRISRPVAITSPTLVSPRRSSCQVSRSDSMESLEQYRGNRSGGAIELPPVSLEECWPAEPPAVCPGPLACSSSSSVLVPASSRSLPPTLEYSQVSQVKAVVKLEHLSCYLTHSRL
ncbi:RING finger protein 212B-like isoform X5 [Polyodon spathula]|uniref:RING finger protein 212B-like isoform X5 n=1 Tax=Polyodon spathula TaxID=7913 RepID=UPI001B7EAEF7|nr:RING finger protein 212B-like isoform X5 [Polyodon spathula]